MPNKLIGGGSNNNNCQCGAPDRLGNAFGGEPINIASGNMFYSVTDYKTAGQNTLDFTRYYNSRGNALAELGANWHSTYDRFIWFYSSSSVDVQRADGQTLRFTLNGTVDSRQRCCLHAHHSGSTWTLTTPNDTVETYSNFSALQPGGRFYIAPDHLGAPHQITDAGGVVVWLWNHDSFGNGAPLGAFSYDLRFPGQFYDQSTKLHYNYFRDYDPRTGRYIESDPIGLAGGINTYAYAEGNPVSGVDPLGLTTPGTDSSPSRAIGRTVEGIYNWCTGKGDDPCPPCTTVTGTVVPVGTIAYRPMDTPPPGNEEHGIVGQHFNIYKANQAPRNSPQPCKCFWQPIGAVAPSGLPGGAIPIEPFAD